MTQGTRSLLLIALVLACFPSAGAGQTDSQTGDQTGEKPYAGLETRDIKALSPGQIEAYASGSGMGLALAAELNRYPGPKHALELRQHLALSEDVTRRTQEIYDGMHSSAVELGEKIVLLEADLDQAFASRELTEDALSTSLMEIAALMGRLRFTHLRAHLQMAEVLSPRQIDEYQRLRGYDDGMVQEHDPAKHHQGH